MKSPITRADTRQAADKLAAAGQRLTARNLGQELGVSVRAAWRALDRYGFHTCPHCEGSGRVWVAQDEAIPMVRKLAEPKSASRHCACGKVAHYVLNDGTRKCRICYLGAQHGR